MDMQDNTTNTEPSNEQQPPLTPPEYQPQQTPPPTPASARSSKRVKRVAAVGIILLFIGVLGALGIQNNFWGLSNYNNQPITSRPTVGNDGNNIKTQQEVDIASVVSKVSPSVVSITTQSQTQTYFGTAEQDGAGTGIVVSSDGYIMTNKHVVNDASTVGVVLADGTTYDDVKVIGSDPLNDVAFLKISNVSNLTPVELGNSSSVRVGQQVVAIGNSLGQYQNTVTSGIISGTGRPVSAQSSNGGSVESLTDLLQTDAAINPGNSGGPLLNMAGQVIGMNTAVAADAQGIGFAIPVNGLKGVLKGVLANGKISRAFLGVSYIPVTPETAKQYNLSVKSGAYVYSGSGKTAVASGSPAEKAGIKDKDVITKVNDIEIGSDGALSTLLGEYAPGDTVTLTLLRDGKEQTVKVTLTAYQ